MHQPVAAAVCRNHGGKLASIHCAAENEFFTSAFAGAEFWIGANDKIDEGTFVWEDKSDFSYKNWNSGEPNNYGWGEDCVSVKNSGTWNDK